MSGRTNCSVSAALSWNRSDFDGLCGPVKRSRKGFAAKLGYDWLVIYDAPRRFDVTVDLAYYDQIDTLPTAQNISTTFTRLVTGEVAARYTDVKRSLGAVDDEKGYTWALVYTGNRVSGEITPQVRGEIAYGFPLPLPHSSLWLRGAAGWANGDRNSTVANFYFGGFGNNYVDDKSIKRYRDYDSLPGFGIDEVSALSFVRGMAEWDLPAYVFESVGTPGFHSAGCGRRCSLPGSGGSPTTPSQRKQFESLGGQADLYFSDAAPLRHDAVGRLRGRAPRFAAQGQRVHDLAQDHVARQAR